MVAKSTSYAFGGLGICGGASFDRRLGLMP
jgi:hypothetical protein